jgi:hypothetical protein
LDSIVFFFTYFRSIFISIETKSVTVQPNLPYIIRFEPYRLRGFVLVTRAHSWAWRSKTRMTSWQPTLLIRPAITPSPVDVRYYNPSFLKSPTTLLAQSDSQWVDSDTKCNSPVQPVIYCLLWALLPSWFLFMVTRAHFWVWHPKTCMTSWQPTLLVRPATIPSPVNVEYYKITLWII